MPKKVVEKVDELFQCQQQLHNDVKQLRATLREIDDNTTVDRCEIFPEAKKLWGKRGLTRYRLECVGTKFVEQKQRGAVQGHRTANVIIFKKLIFARGTDLQKCRIQNQAVKTVIERIAKKAPTGAVPAYHLLGWTPEDVSGADCKPIEVPEMDVLAKCLKEKGPPNIKDMWAHHDICNGEASLVRTAIKNTTHFGTDRGKELGAGAFRYVFSLGPKCVMKLANSLGGADSNLAEYEAWKRIKATKNKDAIKMFLPVINVHPLGLYSIMPKVNTTDVQMRKNEMARDVKNRLDKVGIQCNDVHGNNIGLVGKNKRLVVIDYGLGMVCKIKKKGKEAEVVEKVAEHVEQREKAEKAPRPEGDVAKWLDNVADKIGRETANDKEIAEFVQYWDEKGGVPASREGWLDAYNAARLKVRPPSATNAKLERLALHIIPRAGDVNIKLGGERPANLRVIGDYVHYNADVPRKVHLRHVWVEKIGKGEFEFWVHKDAPNIIFEKEEQRKPKPIGYVVQLCRWRRTDDCKFKIQDMDGVPYLRYIALGNAQMRIPVAHVREHNGHFWIKEEGRDLVEHFEDNKWKQKPKIKAPKDQGKPVTIVPENAIRLPDNARRIVNHVHYARDGQEFKVPINFIFHKHKVQGAYWVVGRGIRHIQQVK